MLQLFYNLVNLDEDKKIGKFNKFSRQNSRFLLELFRKIFEVNNEKKK